MPTTSINPILDSLVKNNSLIQQITIHNFNFTISQFTIHKFTIHKVSWIFLHENQGLMMDSHEWYSTYMMAAWMKVSVLLHMQYSVNTFLFLYVCFFLYVSL